MEDLTSGISFISFGIFALIVMTVVTIAFIMTRYRRCSSNEILVKYGYVGGEKSSVQFHGGATFVWPIIQAYEYMSLEPINTDIDLKNALSKQNIRVSVPSSFTFAIGTTPELMNAAAERLLGMSRKSIEDAAREIIFGQLRATIATMDIEEINGDREKFERQVMENIETELKKIGLYLINVNISDITDESGYLEALGKEAASKAVNEAKVKVAENDRDGETGEAAANAERRENVAKSDAKGEAGFAKADAEKRKAVADAGALAVEAENTAQVKVAQSNSQREVAEAEARKNADAANAVKKAEALAEGYAAEEEAEKARAEKERARQTAEDVVPAEIEAQKRVVEAKAEKEAEVLAGEARGEARKAELMGEAEGLKLLVEAAGGDPDKAAMLMIVQKLDKIAELQAQAISGIEFEKIVVYDGGGQDGTGATAGFMRSLTNMLPQLHEVAQMAGIDLPKALGEMKGEGGEVIEAKASEVAKPEESSEDSSKGELEPAA